QTGLGLCHLPVLYMIAGFGGLALNEKQKRFGHGVDKYLKLIENLNTKIMGQNNQHLGMAFHSLRAVPPEAIKLCLKDSKASGPIHIHISEQMQEVNDCLDWSGMRPVEWLYKHEDVNEKWCLIHATHLNDDEVSSIAKSGAVVGLCPTTEANLGDGLFPLKPFLGQGGKIAIGSDSHVSISMIEELRLLEYGQRLKSQRRNVATGKNDIHTGSYLFHENLKGGAQASGFNNGSIEVGKRADIIVLDQASPLLVGTPDRNIIDRFIFSGNVNPIKHVLVAGKMIISEYHHPLEEQITAEFSVTMKRLQKYLD
ncbi:MAG: formimidoylglutamate deiminase, partial [Kordiimonadaceae bacterium]|nr:formimidoylglutamate deiminase [Kordiimonadaceae bacterium]